ncbi:MAG TPA: head GIN domain-containing protein [Enhygromyxa sp.]|nr:head GIN domain-containing protein [Enhygromyxa sp.]
MTRTLSLPFVLLLLSGCGLRGSGTPATETRELDSFSKIDLGGAFDLVVHVDPGATQKVEVTADDNIIEKIETSVSGGELDVEMKDVSLLRPKTDIVVEVWVPSLAAIDASGASDIDVQGLHGDSFTLELSGASDSTVQGAVERFDIRISGAGELDAKGLHAKSVTLKLSGAGEAVVAASESLDVDISGAGDVTYFGDPTNVIQEISGAGSLKKGG